MTKVILIGAYDAFLHLDEHHGGDLLGEEPLLLSLQSIEISKFFISNIFSFYLIYTSFMFYLIYLEISA